MTSTAYVPGPLQERERALDWLTAASPLVLVAVLFYGWPILGLAVTAAAGYGAVCLLLQRFGLIRALPAPMLTAGVWVGLLLAASTPLWVAAIAGMVAAVVTALPEITTRRWSRSRPLLHPVLMGYLVVALLFPNRVWLYEAPRMWATLDAVPTPSILAPLTDPAAYELPHLLLGIREAALGVGCVPVLLLACGYLALRRRLRLWAPLAMLTTVAFFSWMVWNAPLHGLLVGSTLFAALLLADRACAPVAVGPQLLAGFVAGGLAVLLRAVSGADGCASGVLVACLLSPLYAPFLRLCRRGGVWLWGALRRYVPLAAGWLWGVLRRYVPLAAGWLWKGITFVARKIGGFAKGIFAKKQK